MNVVQDWLDQRPYARFMHIGCHVSDQGLCFKLPVLAPSLGEVITPSLNQGVLSGFMQTSAMAQLFFLDSSDSQFNIMSLSVDYIQLGTYRDTYARCEVKQTQDAERYVCVFAWQTDPEDLIAKAYVYV